MIGLPLLVAGFLLAQPPAGGAERLEAELIHAARIGEAPRVGELLEAGTPSDVQDPRGFTPLMWAAAGGHLDVVRRLLDAGARPNVRTPDGATALVLASANGAADVVAVLIGRGADVSPRQHGSTAADLALARGHVEIAHRLRRLEELGDSLMRAARTTNISLVRQLVAVGAPVNASDEEGVTALMVAAGEGHLGLLQFLLARGADPTQRDQHGRGVFDWAERSPDIGTHVLAYLTARGLTRSPPVVAAAAPPGVRDSLAALGALLARVPERTASTLGPRAVDARRRAGAALSELQALSTRWPAESPADYRDNLDALVRLLDTATSKAPGVRLDDTLELLAEDLEAKLEHCLASGGKLGGSVRVRVRTVRGGEEVRHWQILYMPRIFETSETARPDIFPQLSSPSEELLVPGRYLVWLRDPERGTVTPRTIVKVGEGRSELVVDLPIPGDAAP